MTAPVGKIFVSVGLYKKKSILTMTSSLDNQVSDVKKCKIAETQTIATEFSNCKKVLLLKKKLHYYYINSSYYKGLL